MVESYYAKAMVELGAVGFTILVLSAILMLLACLRVQMQLRIRSLKSVAACGTALAAFIMVVSVKGWAVDTDPLNYYYFLVLGMVFALPYVERGMVGYIPAQASGGLDVAGPRRGAGPHAMLRGQPAMAEPVHRPLIGRHGNYGTVAKRGSTRAPAMPGDRLAPNSPHQGDVGDGNS